MEKKTELALDPETRKAEPFPPGNDLAVRHGGYAVLRLQGRVEELAVVLREAVAVDPARFEAAVQATAVAGARLEAALVALEKADEGAVERLEREAGRWWTRWLAGLDRLGLTPLAASKLGLNVALGQRALESPLERHLAEKYGDAKEREES